MALSNKKSYNFKAFSHVRSSGTDNDQFYTGSLYLVPEVANKDHDMIAQIWGLTYTQIYSKNSNYIRLHRIMNLQWRQPRFLAWLPRWH